MSEGTCAVAGCERPPRSRTAKLCNGHYFRVRRTGETGPAELLPWRAPRNVGCSVEDCERRHSSHGYCVTHWRRIKKGGSPDYVTPIRYGEDNPEWRGDEVGYTAAHERVRRARGSARGYACIDCGEQARHWSYNHADPNERVEGRLAYSPDIAMYEPRCVPCHKRFDLGLIAAKRPACARDNSSTGGAIGAARRAARKAIAS